MLGQWQVLDSPDLFQRLFGTADKNIYLLDAFIISAMIEMNADSLYEISLNSSAGIQVLPEKFDELVDAKKRAVEALENSLQKALDLIKPRLFSVDDTVTVY